MDYQFKSFNNNTEMSYIPGVMKVEDSESKDTTEIIEKFNEIKPKIVFNENCLSYFENRGNIKLNDMNLIEKLKKTIESILIRKNILNKKQEIQKINKKIKVGSIKLKHNK
jgi:hypothetical protein